MGQDLGGVRIHTDSSAAGLARSLGAVAFTVGGDIAFDSGRYAPDSSQGALLLAHELTHAVQQGASTPLTTRDGPDPVAVRERGSERVSREMNAACAGTSRWPGNLEHLYIESNYTTVISPMFGEAEFSIPGGGATGGVGFADLVDIGTSSIYEIKPWVGRASGVDQVRRYRDAAQLFCDPDALWMLGMLYPFTVLPFTPTHDLVSGMSEYPGVIGYWTRLKPPEPIPVDVRDRVERRVEEPDEEPEPRPIRIPQPEPVPWYVPVGAAAAYILWNSKGCLAGPLGCVLDWATPVI